MGKIFFWSNHSSNFFFFWVNLLLFFLSPLAFVMIPSMSFFSLSFLGVWKRTRGGRMNYFISFVR